MSELVGMTISPWTEKARWALDHHGVRYDFTQYVPMIGEPVLRARLRKPFGRVSVPVYFDAGRAVSDSFAIARHAEQGGSGAPLFPAEHAADIVAWNDRGEAALDAARALSMRRMTRRSGVYEESIPPFVPAALRGPLASLAAPSFSYVRSKYGGERDEDATRRALVAALTTLREALAGKRYLLGDFTYADVAMAGVLQGTKPVDHAAVNMGPAVRAAFTDEAVAREFADLLAWRDELYARHRPERAR